MKLNSQVEAWQPPQGFQPVESAVEGITVFAPAPEAPRVQEKITYKCPQCGATTAYDISAGGVSCEHCGYSVQAQAEQVGRRAEEFEFTLETLAQAGQGWGVARRELHCDSCGAHITLSEGALTATCAFCASNEVNLQPAPSDVLRPRFLIPFKMQKQQVSELARRWLGQGWFHPPGLASAASLDRFTGAYLPFWTFDATILSYWKAEVGYERQEHYYDHGSKSWNTRTVVDWRWETGQVTTEIDDLLVSGSSRASRVILDRLAPYHMNELVTYSPDYLAGWQAQAYDISLPDAWETGKSVMRAQCQKACRDDIRSAHVRNFSMTADFSGELWRYILLPVYLAAYRFEDRTYQVMVNGQTGAVAGQKPVAWWKIWAAIAAMLSPGLLLGLVGVPMLLLGGAGVFLLVLAAVLLVPGAYFSFLLYRKAQESEAA